MSASCELVVRQWPVGLAFQRINGGSVGPEHFAPLGSVRALCGVRVPPTSKRFAWKVFGAERDWRSVWLPSPMRWCEECWRRYPGAAHAWPSPVSWRLASKNWDALVRRGLRGAGAPYVLPVSSTRTRVVHYRPAGLNFADRLRRNLQPVPPGVLAAESGGYLDLLEGVLNRDVLGLAFNAD